MSLHMCEFEKNLGFILLITSSYINKFVNYYFIKSSDFMFNLGLQSKRDKSSVVFLLNLISFETFSLLFIFICLRIFLSVHLSFIFLCLFIILFFISTFFLSPNHARKCLEATTIDGYDFIQTYNNRKPVFPNVFKVAEHQTYANTS